MPSSEKKTSSQWTRPRDLTVILPCKGEHDCKYAKTLAQSIHDVVRPHEVIIVPNKPYGLAVKTGIHRAVTEWVAMMDSDGQHQPKQLLKLWNCVPPRRNVVMYIGARQREWHPRDIVSRFLNLAASIVAGRHVPDFGSGLRLIHRPTMLPLLDKLPDHFDFNAVLTVGMLGHHYAVAWVPIDVLPRQAGKSHVTIADGLTTFRALFGAKRRISHHR